MSHTILLVDDNRDNREIYSMILEHSGYTVLQAFNGTEGVRLAGEHRPALVLMDMGMPIMDGWEATCRLKADPATADIPVVALTAHALLEDRERAFEIGCADFIAKPVEPRQVMEIIGRLLGAPGPPAGT